LFNLHSDPLRFFLAMHHSIRAILRANCTHETGPAPVLTSDPNLTRICSQLKGSKVRFVDGTWNSSQRTQESLQRLPKRSTQIGYTFQFWSGLPTFIHLEKRQTPASRQDFATASNSFGYRDSSACKPLDTESSARWLGVWNRVRSYGPS